VKSIKAIKSDKPENMNNNAIYISENKEMMECFKTVPIEQIEVIIYKPSRKKGGSVNIDI